MDQTTPTITPQSLHKLVYDLWTAFKICMFFVGLFFSLVMFQVKVMGKDLEISGNGTEYSAKTLRK